MTICLGIFHVDVYPDGVKFEDVCAAISAAWHAGERSLAKSLAQEYGLYNQICLRCANARIAAGGMGAPKVFEKQLGDYIYQLCVDCEWAELQPQLRGRGGPLKP